MMKPMKLRRVDGSVIELTEIELQEVYDYYRTENIREYLEENYDIPEKYEMDVIGTVFKLLAKDYDEPSAIEEALKKFEMN